MLITCGLNKKVFDLNYMHHVQHEEQMRTSNLINKEQPSMLKTFTNKVCLKNIVWNNNYKMQQFTIFKINEDFIIYDRIKDNEYSIDDATYNEALKEATDLLISWKLM